MTVDYLAQGPHLRRRLIASGVFLVLLVVLVLAWGGGQDPPRLETPPAPQVQPAVGSYVVSWSSPPGLPAASTAEVRSSPSDRPCKPSGEDECTFSGVDDATPWRFTVRELIDGSWTPWSSASTPVPHVSIAVVAGQSNATGWESTVVDGSSHKNVLDEGSSAADGAIRIAWDQPNSISPSSAGLGASGPVPLLTPQILSNASWPTLDGKAVFGPEISMARDLAAGGVKDLVVLKVTEGGTALGGGGPWNPVDGVLYRKLISDAHELQAWEAAQGRSATISVINWYQGETDAASGLGPSYEANLTSLISAMRRDLPTNPATPFIIVKPSIAANIAFQESAGICQPAKCAALKVGDAQVRAADDAVASSMPHVYVVDSVLLPRTGIKLHLSNEGELLLGSELAKVALEAGLT